MFIFFTIFLILAVSAPFLNKITGRHTGLFLSILPASFTFYLVSKYSLINDGGLTEGITWISQLAISIEYKIDGLAFLFAFIVGFIGTLVFIYSDGYLKKAHHKGYFFLILLLFTNAMLSLVLADNLILLYVSWELTSICSYLLIGFHHQEDESRKAAWQALVITATGGLSFLLGGLILGDIAGTYNISQILEHDFDNGPFLQLSLVLMLLGAFTKSAQYPFHSWLPAAMKAPTPVSAYLHSATMVNAGIYLLFRIYPVYKDLDLWFTCLTGVGGVSMVLASLKAMGQTDLKRILAFATISALGLVVFLIGIGSEKSVEAALIFLLLHAIYKGGLFMVAGIIDKTVHTRELSKLSGLRKVLPLTAFAAFFLAASNAGIPPFLGFVGKESIYESILHEPNLLPIFLAVIANTGIVGTAFLVGFKPFAGKLSTRHQDSTQADFIIPPLILAVVGLTGLIPGITGEFMISPAMTSMFPEGVTETKLKLWHGINTPLILSIMTVAAGIALYNYKKIIQQLDSRISEIFSFQKAYEKSFSFLLTGSAKLTQFLQHGYLRGYLLIALLFLVLISMVPIMQLQFPVYRQSMIKDYNVFVISFVIIFAAFFAVLAEKALSALISLGVVGYGLAILFVFLGAPDLAMTQFAVETLTVVLFVLVVYRLPRLSVFSSVTMRMLDFIVSLAAGLVVTVAVYISANAERVNSISNYFVKNSEKLGHGKNIVNVILVDFRALDTMGEVIVLAVAALGVYSLIKLNIKSI